MSGFDLGIFLKENGEEIRSMEDLRGRTIVSAGKGATPEYGLRYLLAQNGIDPDQDVTIDWKSEHAECVAAMAAGTADIAMLPQPFVTAAQGKIEDLRTALDLTAEWDALDNGSAMITGVAVARRAFVEEHPELAERFFPGTLDPRKARLAGLLHDICREDPEALAAVNGADLVLADGIGVIYGAKMLGTPLKGRVTGIGFAQELMARMAEDGKRLFLLGAKPGVAERAAENLQRQYPGLIVAGTHDGYFQEDGPVVEAIRASGADVVFVCLGAPKQEKWMRKNGEATGAHLLVGLGGCLDVFSGEVRRAPEVFQKLGLEWLHRLAKNPSRIGRMMKLPLFLVHVAGEKGKKK